MIGMQTCSNHGSSKGQVSILRLTSFEALTKDLQFVARLLPTNHSKSQVNCSHQPFSRENDSHKGGLVDHYWIITGSFYWYLNISRLDPFTAAVGATTYPLVIYITIETNTVEWTNPLPEAIIQFQIP